MLFTLIIIISLSSLVVYNAHMGILDELYFECNL